MTTTTAQKIENIIEDCTLNRRQGYQAIEQAMRDSAFVLALTNNWKYDETYAEYQISKGVDEETAHLYAMCRTFMFNAFLNAAEAFAKPLRGRNFEATIMDELGPEADKDDFKEAVIRIYGVISDAMRRHDTRVEGELHKAQERAFEEVMLVLFDYCLEVPKEFYDECIAETGGPPKMDVDYFKDTCVGLSYISVEDAKEADVNITAIMDQLTPANESRMNH